MLHSQIPNPVRVPEGTMHHSTRIVIPALVALLAACMLSGCEVSKQGRTTTSDDNQLAYRVVEKPVEDGRNKLLEKYNFGPESRRISDSVQDIGSRKPELDENYIPPRNRWVMLRTTKGDIRLRVYADWAPNAAKRFVELVEQGFYDGAPWFRVNDLIAQSGIAAEPEANERHAGESIERDPMRGSNTRGTISFAQANPDNRNTQFFINIEDNTYLDGTGEDDYFVPFAEVLQGMDVVDELQKTGDPRPGFIEQLATEGVTVFRRQYPQGDVIEFARLMD